MPLIHDGIELVIGGKTMEQSLAEYEHDPWKQARIREIYEWVPKSAYAAHYDYYVNGDRAA
jgi:hypothetical protein